MSKGTPAWKLMGLPEQPPADENGYIGYGTVWHSGMPRPGFVEVWRHEIRWGVWSWYYWSRKIVLDIRHGLRERRDRPKG